MTLITPISAPAPAQTGAIKSDPDEALRLRIADGDQKALAEFMDRHMAKIHSTAYRMLGDQMQAEDVTQMVFLKLWQIAPTWETGRAKILTYLYKVTTHRCLDILRKSKESLPGEMDELIDDSPDALAQITQKEKSASIQETLTSLPHRQRAALTLFYYEHHSLKTAADMMNVTPAAFESLLRRARQSLKSLLPHENVEL